MMSDSEFSSKTEDRLTINVSNNGLLDVSIRHGSIFKSFTDTLLGHIRVVKIISASWFFKLFKIIDQIHEKS